MTYLAHQSYTIDQLDLLTDIADVQEEAMCNFRWCDSPELLPDEVTFVSTITE